MDTIGKILRFGTEVQNLFSKDKWNEVLSSACDPDLETVMYNDTRKVQNFLEDNIESVPPFSFPGKLLAFLFHRFQYFNGASDKGLTIVSNELTNKIEPLEAMILGLAHLNSLEPEFLDWIENSTKFRDSV